MKIPTKFEGDPHSLSDARDWFIKNFKIHSYYKGEEAWYFNTAPSLNIGFWFPGMSPADIPERLDTTPPEKRKDSRVVIYEEQLTNGETVYPEYKELLENVAKKMGIVLQRWNTMYAAYECGPHEHDLVHGFWNPVYNDGDAFRLCVHCGLMVQKFENAGLVRVTAPYSLGTVKPRLGFSNMVEEPYADDYFRASRMAILKAILL